MKRGNGVKIENWRRMAKYRRAAARAASRKRKRSANSASNKIIARHGNGVAYGNGGAEMKKKD
jgi:hypothetical protein